jgi:hypothetical protein
MVSPVLILIKKGGVPDKSTAWDGWERKARHPINGCKS